MVIDPVAAPLSTPIPSATQTPPAGQARADLSQPATAVAPNAPQPTNNAETQVAATEETSNDDADESGGGTQERGATVDVLA